LRDLFPRQPNKTVEIDTQLVRDWQEAKEIYRLAAQQKDAAQNRMLAALGVVKEMMGNQVLANAVERLGDGVRRGAGLSKPMEETGIFPALATHMVRVGEETGRLEEMLLKVGATFETDTRKNVKRLISLIEPGIILVMGLVVGFIVVAMLMAIVSITDIAI